MNCEIEKIHYRLDFLGKIAVSEQFDLYRLRMVCAGGFLECIHCQLMKSRILHHIVE